MRAPGADGTVLPMLPHTAFHLFDSLSDVDVQPGSSLGPRGVVTRAPARRVHAAPSSPVSRWRRRARRR